MLRLSLTIGLAVMLAGCSKAPASNPDPVASAAPTPAPVIKKVADPSWTIANPCPDGVEEVYQTPDGSYTTWISDHWVKLAPALTPEQFCEDSLKGKKDEN
jgi:PBP1b-binding outer membrane lipoprotein LpoB